MPFVVTLRAHVLRTLYPYRDCFEAKVYTMKVHGLSGLDCALNCAFTAL